MADQVPGSPPPPQAQADPAAPRREAEKSASISLEWESRTHQCCVSPTIAKGSIFIVNGIRATLHQGNAFHACPTAWSSWRAGEPGELSCPPVACTHVTSRQWPRQVQQAVPRTRFGQALVNISERLKGIAPLWHQQATTLVVYSVKRSRPAHGPLDCSPWLVSQLTRALETDPFLTSSYFAQVYRVFV